MRKLPVALIGGALALATFSGAVADTARASVADGTYGGTSGTLGTSGTSGTSGSDGTYGGTSGTLDPGSRFDTGSANLDKLASSLGLYNRSVTAVLRAPAGLRLTRPVDIVVRFGSTTVSRAYSNAYGNRIVHDFDPGTGELRREPVTIVLNERDPATNRTLASFTLNTGVEVLALWDVIVNPLRITFWQQCDWHSDADPHVNWRDATGTAHSAVFDPDFGETIAIDEGFSGIWHEVQASDPLYVPVLRWREWDWVAEFDPQFGDGAGDPLLPTEDQDNSFIIEDDGGSCSAVFSYSVRVVLRTYPGLPTA